MSILWKIGTDRSFDKNKCMKVLIKNFFFDKSDEIWKKLAIKQKN